MKIAVATTEETSIAQHFGKSTGFMVFEIEDQQIRSREFRTNRHTPHAQGVCRGEEHEHGGHNHGCGGVVGLLHDCAVVLCGGMGGGAAQALTQQGIQPFVLPSGCSAEEAVVRYLQGSIEAVPAGLVACRH